MTKDDDLYILLVINKMLASIIFHKFTIPHGKRIQWKYRTATQHFAPTKLRGYKEIQIHFKEPHHWSHPFCTKSA